VTHALAIGFPAMSRTSAALELRNIGLDIGGARILHDVSLSIAAGEMIGVIGPNGAGKTTLFNVISGIATASTGAVLIDDVDVTGHSVSRRAANGLGRTFQSSSLFHALDAQENVRLAAQAHRGSGASLLRFPRQDDAASVTARDRLEEVDLAHRSKVLAGNLSHGEKRKLEIAMLLAAEPSVVLLDEPMAGVGSGDVQDLEDTIRRLHRSGRTVLMVEHHMEVVLGLADRVAVMHHGELLAFGSPDDVVSDAAVQAAYLGEPL